MTAVSGINKRKRNIVNERLMSKEHYCYKIHTSLTKSSAYALFIDNPAIWIIALHFYKKILSPTPLLWSLKNLNPLWISRGFHTMTLARDYTKKQKASKRSPWGFLKIPEQLFLGALVKISEEALKFEVNKSCLFDHFT